MTSGTYDPSKLMSISIDKLKTKGVSISDKILEQYNIKWRDHLADLFFDAVTDHKGVDLTDKEKKDLTKLLFEQFLEVLSQENTNETEPEKFFLFGSGSGIMPDIIDRAAILKGYFPPSMFAGLTGVFSSPAAALPTAMSTPVAAGTTSAATTPGTAGTSGSVSPLASPGSSTSLTEAIMSTFLHSPAK